MKRYTKKTIGFLDGRQALFGRRYVEGGGDPNEPATPSTDPAVAAVPITPPESVPATPTTSPPKSYTEEELQVQREKAVEDYKKHLEEAKDYDKMTPEEKVAFLEKQRDEDKLSAYTLEKLSKLDLSPDLLPFIRGKDENDTNERLKSFKSSYDKEVQKTVEKRMKTNGYLPRGTAAGSIGGESKKTSRGVTVNN